jgi:phospholipid transport system substrate-binding protein
MTTRPTPPAHSLAAPAHKLRRALHLAALGLVLVLAAAFTAAPAGAKTPVEKFVQVNVDKGMDILNDKTLSENVRRTKFRDLLLGLADARRTALFTLGAARRTTSAHDIDAFVDAFKEYAIAVYQSRLSAYSGQTLKVTGATERAPGDYVVTSVLVNPNASSDAQPIHINFRIDNEKGSFKVLDVSVVGVWLAIEERDQFTAFLSQHNRSVPALTKHLKELTARLQSSNTNQARNK